MGQGHYPDLDEVRARADVIEKKHKDLRTANAVRKLADECEQYRNGVPVVAPGQVEQSLAKVMGEAGAREHREG